MDPLVSVLMPCYNSAATLPRALASLSAQTYANWECVLVDDGSTDRPAETVEQFGDPRVRLIRHPANLGRGAARQTSVDSARGPLLAMLDADDWIYPEKLKAQVEALTANPSIVLVSGAFGIVDRNGDLTGVRGPAPSAPLVTDRYFRGTALWCPYASSMYRAEAGAGVRFDTSLRCSEDADFLSRILDNRAFAMFTDVQYAYTEYGSVTLEKMMESAANNARMYMSWRADFPIRSRWLAFKALTRMPVYRAAERLGMWEQVLKRRSVRPTARQLTDFRVAAAAVDEKMRRHFGENAVGVAPGGG